MLQWENLHLEIRIMPDTNDLIIDSLPTLHLPATSLDDLFAGVGLLSLDVFDTILARRCLKPTDIFTWMEEAFHMPGFCAKRISAEAEARKRHRKRGSEVSIDEIYDVLGTQLDLPDDAIERELQAEEAFLFASPTAVRLITEARARKIRAIAVSDIYLHGSQVTRLLAASGVSVDAVYTSADLRIDDMGKYNGKVYDHVAGQQNTAPDKILHIGDNRVSDFQHAQAAGLKTILVSNLHEITADLNDHVRNAANAAETSTGRMIAGQATYGAVTGRAKMATLEGFGYCFGGPLLLGMVKFLVERADSSGIHRILLLERDGNILREALDILEPHIGPYPFDYRLVPSSRRMAVFPLLLLHGFRGVEQLFAGMPDKISAQDFFGTLALDLPRDYVPCAEELPPIVHFEQHAPYLVAQAERERIALQRLLAAELAMSHDNQSIAWFDVGWALSSAAALNDLLDVDWPCFCIGSHRAAKKALPQIGYLFERGEPTWVELAIMSGAEPLELIFSAIAPLTHYAVPTAGGGATKITAPHSGSARVRDAFVGATWAGTLRFITDAAPLAIGMASANLRTYNRQLFVKLCKYPTSRQYAMLGAVPHNRGAGNSSWKSIADYWTRPPSQSRTGRMAGDVGIVMRTRNRPVLLRRALADVRAQIFTDWNLVVVNDGGDKADVDAAIKGVFSGDPRVSVVHNAESLGMEAASNAGLDRLTTEFAVIHDDDDSWDARFLATALEVLDKQSAKFPTLGGIVLGIRAVFETIDGNKVVFASEYDWHADPKRPLENGLMDLRRLLAQNAFPPIAFVYHLATARDLGLYREDLPVLGDWDFHRRFAIAHDIWVHPEPLANYHHRLDETGDQGNSIIVCADKHRHYAQMLKNEWCRAELGKDASNGSFEGMRVLFERSVEDRLDRLEASVNSQVPRTKTGRRRYILFGPREV